MTYLQAMKRLLLITALALSTTPAHGQTRYNGGIFTSKSYTMTFHRIPGAKHKYAVSVVESRSPKDDNGFIVPSSLGVDCKKGKAKGYVAMGKTDMEFNQEILIDYLKEFCSRNAYQGYGDSK